MEVWEKIKRDIAWLFLFIMFITWIISISPLGRDSTDGDERSNMELHTDNLTGCQYLSVPHGGLYPRLNIDGKPMCEGYK